MKQKYDIYFAPKYNDTSELSHTVMAHSEKEARQQFKKEWPRYPIKRVEVRNESR